jgi:hypothetical protein
VHVFDAQDKLRECEFLRQGIIIWYIINVTHEPIYFNVFLLEGRKEKARLGLVIEGNMYCLQL